MSNEIKPYTPSTLVSDVTNVRQSVFVVIFCTVLNLAMTAPLYFKMLLALVGL